MKGFTIISPALDREAEALYIDGAIYLAVELAIKFREEMRVFTSDKSTMIALIKGDKIQEYQLKPKEIKFSRGKP